MLTIIVPGIDLFDEAKNLFIQTESMSLELEHSLVSLSKWESIYEKPFLGSDRMSTEETREYIKCMSLTKDFPPDGFTRLSADNLSDINNYISKKMTATWFSEIPGRTSSHRDIITAEIIYYWMFTMNIPKECEDWHLNRLLTLIRVISEKNTPAKKMPRKEAMAQRRALMDARRAQQGSKG